MWYVVVFCCVFTGFSQETHTHTKHQISQAQLKAEKETSAKALAECEKTAKAAVPVLGCARKIVKGW